MKSIMKHPWIGALMATALLLPGVRTNAVADEDNKSETVIVPYDSKKPIQNQNPDQFYLPYERFLELWQAAKQNREGEAPPPAAAVFVLTAARYDGVVGDHSVAFSAKLDITTYNDPWVKIPLPFKDIKMGMLKLDGQAAPLQGGSVIVEKPGRHTLEAAFEIPFKPGAKSFAWGIPRTSATLVTLTLPDERTRAIIMPGSGVIERTENGHNLVSAALGATDHVKVDLEAFTSVRVTEPAVAAITESVDIRAGVEETNARFAFSFPEASQERFVVYLKEGLSLIGIDAANLKSWKLSPDAGKQALEIVLNEPAKEEFSMSIQTQRALPPLPTQQTAPVFSAAAKRLDYSGAAFFAADHLDVTLKPAASQRQIPWNEPGCSGVSFIAAYAGPGTLSYSVKVADPKREAHVDYVYQVNRRKIELMASLQLSAKGDDLSTMSLTLPAQFEVQAVESERLQDWWRDGNTLRLRFRGQTPESTSLVVYLVRYYPAAPTELDVRPLTLEGFKNVTGEAVIAAHKGVDVAMKLSTDATEISAAKAATDFQILPPLERKRGFTFKTQKFAAEVSLSALPARINALWVMHAQAHEGWLSVSLHARLNVRQGSVDRASFSLPASVAEARVTGSEVRETRSHVEGRKRIYDVQFQNDVYESVEFTVDTELPDLEDVELPQIAFPEAQMTTGFVLTENVSEYEMHMKTNGVDPAPTSEIPFLPDLTKGAGVFRTEPEWSVKIGLDRLEKATARAAFVEWAEMTSAVRSDGTEWHRASYRLQNRSLQFLPVRMPSGAELMSVRVAGQSVRADTGKINGVEALLIPLIKTKPGDLSYNVDLVYRLLRSAPGWRDHRSFEEPELPGITVERTLWNVWLPDNRKLAGSGGNMEPVLGDLNKTEKLESKLQELKQLVSIVSASGSSEEARQNAKRNLVVLKRELETENRDQEFSQTNMANEPGMAPKPTPGDEAVGKKALAQQGAYVATKRKSLNDELGREVEKLSKLSAENAPGLEPIQNQTQTSQTTQTVQGQIFLNSSNWASNSAYSGKGSITVQPQSQTAPAAALADADSSNLFFNDNIVLQKRGKKGGENQGAARGEKDATRAQKELSAEVSKDADQDEKNITFQTARGNNMRLKQKEEAEKQQIAQTQATDELKSRLLPGRPAAGVPAAPAAQPQQSYQATAPGANPLAGSISIANGAATPNTFAAPGLGIAAANPALSSPALSAPAGALSINGTTLGVTPGQRLPPPPPSTTNLGSVTLSEGRFTPSTPTAMGSLTPPVQVQRDTIGGVPQSAPVLTQQALSPPPPEEPARAEAERLQSSGRISLDVDFPPEGQIYHFKKVKANARLELTVTNPAALTRWKYLAIALVLGSALYGIGKLIDWRIASRRYKTA